MLTFSGSMAAAEPPEGGWLVSDSRHIRVLARAWRGLAVAVSATLIVTGAGGGPVAVAATGAATAKPAAAASTVPSLAALKKAAHPVQAVAKAVPHEVSLSGAGAKAAPRVREKRTAVSPAKFSAPVKASEIEKVPAVTAKPSASAGKHAAPAPSPLTAAQLKAWAKQVPASDVEQGKPVKAVPQTKALALKADGVIADAASGCDTYGPYSMCGAILTKYQSMGSSASALGSLTDSTSEAPCGCGQFNSFTNGAIYSGPFGTFYLTGPILSDWGSMGWEQDNNNSNGTGGVGWPLGDPVQFTDPTTGNTVVYQDFERPTTYANDAGAPGVIVWGADTGTVGSLRGSFLAKYNATQGAEA
jgi:uncharacterized protein with LGFP repeats